MLQWDIGKSAAKVVVECLLVKLTSDPWDTLDDCADLYQGILPMPNVSSSPKPADITDYIVRFNRSGPNWPTLPELIPVSVA